MLGAQRASAQEESFHDKLTKIIVQDNNHKHEESLLRYRQLKGQQILSMTRLGLKEKIEMTQIMSRSIQQMKKLKQDDRLKLQIQKLLQQQQIKQREQTTEFKIKAYLSKIAKQKQEISKKSTDIKVPTQQQLNGLDQKKGISSQPNKSPVQLQNDKTKSEVPSLLKLQTKDILTNNLIQNKKLIFPNQNTTFNSSLFALNSNPKNEKDLVSTSQQTLFKNIQKSDRSQSIKGNPAASIFLQQKSLFPNNGQHSNLFSNSSSTTNLFVKKSEAQGLNYNLSTPSLNQSHQTNLFKNTDTLKFPSLFTFDPNKNNSNSLNNIFKQQQKQINLNSPQINNFSESEQEKNRINSFAKLKSPTTNNIFGVSNSPFDQMVKNSINGSSQSSLFGLTPFSGK